MRIEGIPRFRRVEPIIEYSQYSEIGMLTASGAFQRLQKTSYVLACNIETYDLCGSVEVSLVGFYGSGR